jgi:hypothetical protein
MADTKKDALVAFDAFGETWGVKCDKAVECLIKDRDDALEASAHDQRHRKRVRDHPPPHGALQGMSLQQDRARHDLQARRGRPEKLAC